MRLQKYERVALVTNGWSTEIVIGRDQKLYLTYDDNREQIPLGPATKKRIDEIIYNLNQLKSVLP